MSIKKENYYKIRRHFTKLLGGKCSVCGTFFDIEFDHIKPNGKLRHEVGTSERCWEWFEAYDQGNLQLLCSKCNKLKSDKQ